MSKLLIALGFAAASVLPAAAAPAAAGAAAAAQSGEQPQAQDPGRRICRSLQRTGGRTGPRRICRTAAEWDEARRGVSRDEELQAAADTLELVTEKISTGDTGGMSTGYPPN